MHKDAFGNSFAEVHEFLDQYAPAFPDGQHRKFFHHRQGIALIAERFGPEAVKAAERHILEDEGTIPEDHTYYQTENEELTRMVRAALQSRAVEEHSKRGTRKSERGSKLGLED